MDLIAVLWWCCQSGGYKRWECAVCEPRYVAMSPRGVLPRPAAAYRSVIKDINLVLWRRSILMSGRMRAMTRI